MGLRKIDIDRTKEGEIQGADMRGIEIDFKKRNGKSKQERDARQV